MVGVRTSNRCDNCRRRKKKCGEQKPSCSECIRAGWTCPGYQTQWKFVDESRQLAEHYARKKYAFDSRDLASEGACSRNDPEDIRCRGMMLVWQSDGCQPGSHLPYNNNQMRALANVPRYYETNRLGSALVYCLETRVKETLVPLPVIGSFFQFIPARLGYNMALDDAVSCLSAIYCESPFILHNAHRSICQAYVRALSSLRTCLSDTSLQMEPETLCASILLQLCELVINVDKGEWSHLARGTSFLLYSRGVHRYTSPFEHAMLESQLPYVLSQSVRSKEPCFLSGLEWQALLGQSPVWPFHTAEPRSLSLRSRLCGILVEVPSLIIHSSKINENNLRQAASEEHLDLLISKASLTLANVKSCLTVDAEPMFLSYTSSLDQVAEEQINYPDILAGVLDCVANTSILSINKILRSLQDLKLRSSILMGRSSQLQLENNQLLDPPEITERRRQRATNAFKFVQGESKLAAKPLEFGVQQIQSNGSN